jgi:hypothetical protein
MSVMSFGVSGDCNSSEWEYAGAMWWRYALRRAFFGLVGLLLFTVPLFGGLRYMAHRMPVCGSGAVDCTGLYQHGLRDGRFYLLWQGGPVADAWPIALALLGTAALAEASVIASARLRR